MLISANVFEQFEKSSVDSGDRKPSFKAPCAEVVTVALSYKEKGQNNTKGMEERTEWQALTQNSFDIALQKVLKIAQASGCYSQLKEAVMGKSMDEKQFVESIAPFFQGLSFVAAFKAKEFMTKDGNKAEYAEYWYCSTVDNLEKTREYIAKNPDKARKALQQEATVESFGVVPGNFDPFGASSPGPVTAPSEDLPF
jgi:hypothetical protein